ncbi:hypothetical protein V6N13_055843 [Hibiscus sabdariffa]
MTQQAISLFVDNLPKALHWKGLWQVFGRYGEVVDAFIARKVSRGGRRFGFVRFANREDAVVASKRLNGFFLYGFRIFTAFAKFNGRLSYWRKVRRRLPQENEENNEMSKTKQKEKLQADMKEQGESSK